MKEELRANLLERLGSASPVPTGGRVRGLGAPGARTRDPRRSRPRHPRRARAGQDTPDPPARRPPGRADARDRRVRGERPPVPPDLRGLPAPARRGRGRRAAPVDRPEDRYAEKLATPDTSVADLIGDVDPIRVAEGRYLADELTIHYGMIPRTNRGIVAINELPDLPERIQVALFNILEERDVQIRGYRIRLPLDLLLVATANPDDYTHRGRIVSPLKDRFGTQVARTTPSRSRTRSRSWSRSRAPGTSDVPVRVPVYLEEVLAAFTAELRRSPHVNHRSGVSVRYSIGNLETLSAAAIRRAARTGEAEAVPRVCDLPAVVEAGLGGSSSTRSRRAARRRSCPGPSRRPSSRCSAGGCRASTSSRSCRGSRRGSRPRPRTCCRRASCWRSSASSPGCPSCCSVSASRRSRRAWRPPRWSSRSRACTCRAGSTRTWRRGRAEPVPVGRPDA